MDGDRHRLVGICPDVLAVVDEHRDAGIGGEVGVLVGRPFGDQQSRRRRSSLAAKAIRLV
jgi:hypothetical protein